MQRLLTRQEDLYRIDSSEQGNVRKLKGRFTYAIGVAPQDHTVVKRGGSEDRAIVVRGDGYTKTRLRQRRLDTETDIDR